MSREIKSDTYSATWQRQTYHKRRAEGLCGKCGKTLDRQGSLCQACLVIVNAADKLDANKRYREKLRTTVFEHYGNKCACCGEHRMTMLHIDHIEGGGNEHRAQISNGKRRSASGSETYRWIIKNDFPDTLQILCANCNDSKRRNGGICEHLTESN
jgi:hypothetical protein